MIEWYPGITLAKDPADELVYDVDFGGEFGLNDLSSGDVVGSDVDVLSSTISGQVLTFKVGGGVAGVNGSVTMTVQSDSETPEKLERTINFEVEDL